MKTAATYGRVSTDNQEAEGTSLQTQLEACLKYCEDKGYNVAHRFSEAYSGLTLERPKLNDLRELVRAGEIDVIVVYCLDRLSRDPTHGVIIMQELEKHRVTLEAVTETVDSSEVGKLINYIGGYASKLEAEKIRERTVRGKKARAREGRVDVVLCYDPDRLSRNLSNQLLLSDEFERAGVRLEFITHETDASPEGKMFFAIRGAVAEYERAKTRERTMQGRLEKARQGKVINTRCLPTWLRYDRETETVHIDEEWAKVVCLSFRLVADEGLKLDQLRRRFNSLNIRTPQGGTHWQISTLHSWLTNPAAKGEYYQLRYQKVEPKQRHKPTGKRRKTSSLERDRSQWEVVRVPPIVTVELWDAVQRRLGQNKALATRNTHRGNISCGDWCAAGIVAVT